MNYKKLGNTDLNVSTICLGTMTWGEQNSQEEGFEQMDYALEKGINFFDTAELYAVPPKKETYGKTEEIIGNWFNAKKNRKKIILATKIAGNGLSWIRDGGFQYDEKNITEAIENLDLDNTDENLEDDTVLLEDETDIDPAADVGIKPTEDTEDEY